MYECCDSFEQLITEPSWRDMTSPACRPIMLYRDDYVESICDWDHARRYRNSRSPARLPFSNPFQPFSSPYSVWNLALFYATILISLLTYLLTYSAPYRQNQLTFGHEIFETCDRTLGLRRGNSGPALGGTEYRLMPSACRLTVQAKLWNLQFRYLVSRAPMRRRSIVVV